MTEQKIEGIDLWKKILLSNLNEMLSYVFIVVIIVALGWYTGWWSETDFFGLSIQVVTLLGLVWVKLSQMKQEWISAIPDYLTVEYVFEDQVQIKAEYIPLVSLSGVREQVQAIAKALNNETNVALYPVLHKIEHGEIVQVERTDFEHNGQAIELHKATIELKNKLPELTNEDFKTKKITPAKLSQFGVDVDLGEYLYWGYPFKDSDIIINNREHEFVRLANDKEAK